MRRTMRCANQPLGDGNLLPFSNRCNGRLTALYNSSLSEGTRVDTQRLGDLSRVMLIKRCNGLPTQLSWRAATRRAFNAPSPELECLGFLFRLYNLTHSRCALSMSSPPDILGFELRNLSYQGTGAGYSFTRRPQMVSFLTASLIIP